MNKKKDKPMTIEEKREKARKNTLARIRSLHEQANRLQGILDGRIK